jgi:hypothetical protein
VLARPNAGTDRKRRCLGLGTQVRRKRIQLIECLSLIVAGNPAAGLAKGLQQRLQHGIVQRC